MEAGGQFELACSPLVAEVELMKAKMAVVGAACLLNMRDKTAILDCPMSLGVKRS